MGKATRDAYGEVLQEIGHTYPNLVVLDADLSQSTKTYEFKKVFPERHFNVGIAEQNLMSVSAGLAASGKSLLPRLLLFSVPGEHMNKFAILFVIRI